MKELEFERTCSKASDADDSSKVAGDVLMQGRWVTPRTVLLYTEN
jgi:hypothetical protein